MIAFTEKIKKNCLAKFKKLFGLHGKFIYSQEGEDLILKKAFARKRNGFFIDVGAHHPTKFSNTYMFYKEGWRGVNIDAAPGSMRIFNKTRPRDINIESAISNQTELLTFYEFNSKALSTFDKNLAKRNAHGGYRVVAEHKIKTRRLDQLLGELDIPKTIEFMSIDVEGLECQVVKSNDWQIFRPKVIAVEILDTTFETLSLNPVCKLLSEQNYVPFAKTFNTLFLRDCDFEF